MITKVTVRYFKQFESEVFDLSDHVILAGPNNSGKSTLLQAIVVWSLALQKWKLERPRRAGARQRSGIPITRKEFTAIPLREMNLLWTNTSTAMGRDEAQAGKAGYPRVLEIALEGMAGDQSWEMPFEFTYSSSEQIHVKPAEKYLDNSPPALKTFNVVHVPPFSGIGTEETRYDRPYQDLLIGQGKAGDILRNLLLDVHKQQGEEAWEELCQQVRDVFGYQLSPPRYEGEPFIVCEYLPGIPPKRGRGGLPRLDVACAGSGFHQVLMLLAFFYARPSSVLLLDEPDAHQHIILQKQTYDMLRRIASRRKCQLVIATHSEVLVDNTSPHFILSFYKRPHRLITEVERDQVREALKWLTATDLLLGEQSPGVLYLEGESDFGLLKAWARVLNHPLRTWFDNKPFWHANRGRHPREARGHFFAVRAVRPEMKGILLLDGDNRELPEGKIRADGLTVERWRRYEAESYLLHPVSLLRYIGGAERPLFAEKAKEFLRDQIPPVVFRDPLLDHEYLKSTPVSKTLLPGFFKAAGLDLSKSEYYLVAEQMKPDEIAAEVKEKLDSMAQVFGLMPSEGVGVG